MGRLDDTLRRTIHLRDRLAAEPLLADCVRAAAADARAVTKLRGAFKMQFPYAQRGADVFLNISAKFWRNLRPACRVVGYRAGGRGRRRLAGGPRARARRRGGGAPGARGRGVRPGAAAAAAFVDPRLAVAADDAAAERGVAAAESVGDLRGGVFFSKRWCLCSLSFRFCGVLHYLVCRRRARSQHIHTRFVRFYSVHIFISSSSARPRPSSSLPTTSLGLRP